MKTTSKRFDRFISKIRNNNSLYGEWALVRIKEEFNADFGLWAGFISISWLNGNGL